MSLKRCTENNKVTGYDAKQARKLRTAKGIIITDNLPLSSDLLHNNYWLPLEDCVIVLSSPVLMDVHLLAFLTGCIFSMLSITSHSYAGNQSLLYLFGVSIIQTTLRKDATVRSFCKWRILWTLTCVASRISSNAFVFLLCIIVLNHSSVDS